MNGEVVEFNIYFDSLNHASLGVDPSLWTAGPSRAELKEAFADDRNSFNFTNSFESTANATYVGVLTRSGDEFIGSVSRVGGGLIADLKGVARTRVQKSWDDQRLRCTDQVSRASVETIENPLRTPTSPQTVTPTNSANQSNSTSDLVEDLNRLTELFEEGLLNEEEFNAAKRRLLGL